MQCPGGRDKPLSILFYSVFYSVRSIQTIQMPLSSLSRKLRQPAVPCPSPRPALASLHPASTRYPPPPLFSPSLGAFRVGHAGRTRQVWPPHEAPRRLLCVGYRGALRVAVGLAPAARYDDASLGCRVPAGPPPPSRRVMSDSVEHVMVYYPTTAFALLARLTTHAVPYTARDPPLTMFLSFRSPLAPSDRSTARSSDTASGTHRRCPPRGAGRGTRCCWCWASGPCSRARTVRGRTCAPCSLRTHVEAQDDDDVDARAPPGGGRHAAARSGPWSLARAPEGEDMGRSAGRRRTLGRKGRNLAHTHPLLRTCARPNAHSHCLLPQISRAQPRPRPRPRPAPSPSPSHFAGRASLVASHLVPPFHLSFHSAASHPSGPRVRAAWPSSSLRPSGPRRAAHSPRRICRRGLRAPPSVPRYWPTHRAAVRFAFVFHFRFRFGFRPPVRPTSHVPRPPKRAYVHSSARASRVELRGRSSIRAFDDATRHFSAARPHAPRTTHASLFHFISRLALSMWRRLERL